MANINDAFPSSWLKAEDLPPRTKVVVVIADVAQEQIGDDHKPVLRFRGKEKGLVLNKTNALAIAAQYGNEMDDWRGKSIKLYATTTPYGGKIVPCIRVWDEPQDEVPPPPVGDEDIPF